MIPSMATPRRLQQAKATSGKRKIRSRMQSDGGELIASRAYHHPYPTWCNPDDALHDKYDNPTDSRASSCLDFYSA